ncbi:ABC transporter ATP-binding protein [soil metagenome]
MPESIITVQNLSKRFILNHEGDGRRYKALRDVVTNGVKGIFQGRRKAKTSSTEEFWALKDLNFDIQQGDRVGIIGRNGAGKSTLLKVLSRITEPTSGSIKINGRVASLLEVGTGFHPELTGSENIFLNGAILGMSRAEIRRKFDEIVAFAEVEKFLDTPVKRYSSGMYVRLAFAVAAHLEPEILVVDEVLAVGDAEFQKKCLGKMQTVSGEGRTVIFVSHNMLAVKSLCTKGILLNKGKIESIGEMESVISSYITGAKLNVASFIEVGKEAAGIRINSVTISNNGVSGNFNISDDLVFEIDITGYQAYGSININLFFKDSEDTLIFATCSEMEEFQPGRYNYKCTIPKNTLNDNVYSLDLMAVGDGANVLIQLKDIIFIEGVEVKRDGPWMGKFPGLIRPLYYKWSKTKIDESI